MVINNHVFLLFIKTQGMNTSAAHKYHLLFNQTI